MSRKQRKSGSKSNTAEKAGLATAIISLLTARGCEPLCTNRVTCLRLVVNKIMKNLVIVLAVLTIISAVTTIVLYVKK